MTRFTLSILSTAFDVKKLVSTHSKNVVVSFLNPYSFMTLRKELSEEVALEIDYFFTDSTLMEKLSGIAGHAVSKASFDFSSVAPEVFEYCSVHGLSVAVVGGKRHEIDHFRSVIQTKWPELNVCFTRHGFELDRSILASQLNQKTPQVLILGLGTPLQEETSVYLKHMLKEKCIIFTCGGFISQTFIRQDYYYPMIARLNLRWLQRLISEKHTRSRIFNEYIEFVVLFMREYCKMKGR